MDKKIELIIEAAKNNEEVNAILEKITEDSTNAEVMAILEEAASKLGIKLRDENELSDEELSKIDGGVLILFYKKKNKLMGVNELCSLV